MLIVLAFGMLIGFGATAQISIRLGEKRRPNRTNPGQCHRAAWLGASLLMTVLGLLLLDPS